MTSKFISGAALAITLALAVPVFAPAGGAATAAGLPTGTAVARAEIIPEWYQFCYNIRPVGITAGKSGYMNAYSSAGGVTCKWWVMPWRAGFPYIATKYYSWNTVCNYYGRSYVGFKSGLPRCR